MEPPTPSQTSSHFTIEPIPASTLADREIQRRNDAVALGYCKTGCSELDEHVLRGGFERGCVVGISSEDEEFGVQLGLQTLAHSLTRGIVRTGMIVTPRPARKMLDELVRSLRAEVRTMGDGGSEGEVEGRVRAWLDCVLVACVFDLDGLWEALAELDRPEEGKEGEEKMGEDQGGGGDAAVEEIRDSQDSSSSPERPASPPPPSSSPPPDIIVITHFSSLLTSLFTHREKSAAHTTLQLLSSHLRYLSRSLSSSPLLLILNATTTTTTTTEQNLPIRRPPRDTRPLDQTLSSIFNVPPDDDDHRRRNINKPRFGSVFAQLLDVHLLCSRVPRAKDDAEAAAVEELRAVRMAWVVECLLDEVGVWEGTLGRRQSREQRWAAVDVRGGTVKNAFERKTRKMDVGEVKVAGGFGGRRV